MQIQQRKRAVGVVGWLGKPGQKVGVAVGYALPVLQRVGVRRKELDPTPDAGVVFSDLGDALERLVVRVDLEAGGP